MNILDIHRHCGGNPLHASNDEWHDACPDCGGTDRFSIHTECRNSNGRFFGGRFNCRGCGINGDAVNYLQKRRGLSFRDACRYLEIDPGIMPEYRTGNIKSSWEPAQPKATPGAVWQAKAERFIRYCVEQLARNSEAMAWLQSERGLTNKTIRAARLGWNPFDVYQSREVWGLPSGKKLRLPKGLVIPFCPAKAVLRLRVRHPELPQDGNRYWNIAGSFMGPMVLWQNQDAVCILESELDALLVHQECSDIVGVVSLGSAALKPDSELHQRLMNAKTVLCSLDADEAGVKAVGFWKQYPGFKRWPVVRGKDPTEQLKSGIPIRAWIEAGLQ
jgi:DNA primase